MTGSTSLSAQSPDKTSASAESAGLARSQKPETTVARTNTAVSLLNQPVERPAEATHANPMATILAVVNLEPILDEEVKVSCLQQLVAARTAKEQREVINQALDQIIDREIVLQEAISRLEKGGKEGAKFIAELKKIGDKEFERRWLKPLMKEKHATDVKEFTEYLRDNHVSLEAMRRMWQRNFMAMEYLRSRIDPHLSRIGHTEIADYYASHREEFTQADSVHWQDIFIDATQHASREAAHAFAESLVRRARQGEDFVQLSAEFDNGTSGKFRKGDGQGHKRGEIFPPEAEPILFGMHDNDVDVIERGRGFHVIRLVKRQHAGPIPFDDKVQKEIRDKLRNLVFQREMKRIVTDLKRRAIIEKNPKLN
jgi:parvulin-like peptidyl-prolyl isomerase